MSISKALFCLLISPLICLSANAQVYQYPFQNPTLTVEQRSADLVKRLTLEEKVAQMLNNAPAIDRLGVPAYNWWNETLHGVARTEYKVTVYPQAIAMAAGWDADAIKLMGDYSAEEGRAIFNASSAKGNRGIYHGLTYWTPNINIFRDPRWGRGQETYGEDPFLTATLGKAIVKGLQGNDPVYLKSAACAKHYAVHSGPESSRHSFNTVVSDYDLWDTYLPAFKALVTDAKVAGVMCAYNAYATQPCCGSDLLMNDILRNQWKFTGYVTSDCGAIDDFFNYHKTHPDAQSAAVDAVNHGTDVECGNYAYTTLVNAVKNGVLKESQIDVSLQRLFDIRFRLGILFPRADDPYAKIGLDALESNAHKQLSLKMARQSIVLLKNDNHTLPLSKSIKKIAIVGPNADNETTVLGNYNGTPTAIATPLKGITEKLGPGVEVVYEKGINYTNNLFFNPVTDPKALTDAGEPGFKVEYFNNITLDGTPASIKHDASLKHSWNANTDVTDGVKANAFSARWTTQFTPTASGNYTFQLSGEAGYRLLIDDKEVITDWKLHRVTNKEYSANFTAGTPHKVVVEYYHSTTTGRKGAINLVVGQSVQQINSDIAARVKDADAIIFVGGISPRLEGEEMKVSEPGFSGGDRTAITLPTAQTDLLKALQATGKPVVLVLMTGSAIGLEWENAHIPAIVNAWYDGQSAGTAIADVLFGDYNPSGKLPVTFYKSEKDLPAFDDYSMNNRTYRYFKGKALFPFGFGLSYTSFAYTWAKAPAKTCKANGSISCTINVKNIGVMAGDDVVQVYIEYPQTGERMPLKELRQFNRISLSKDQSSAIKIEIPVSALQKWNAKQNKLAVKTGTYNVVIGSSSEDKKLLAQFTVQN